VGQREVVGAADHADVVRAVVLLGEVRVLVRGALGGLDIGEADAAAPQGRPGHVALVTGDVHAFDGGQRGHVRLPVHTVAALVLQDGRAHVGRADLGGVGTAVVRGGDP